MPTNPAYSSPSYTKSPITGDQLSAAAPNAVRQLWKKGVEVHEETNDFFAEMEGRSPMSPIQVESSLSTGAGQKITFTNRSGLYAEPHHGDDRFHDSSHYEDLKIGSNELLVDWLRHGIEFTERSEEVMGMRGELMDGLPDALGEWAGRQKTEKMFMTFRERVNAENKISVKTALNWKTIVEHTQTMKRWGAAGAHIGRTAKGESVRGYVVVTPEDALTSMELDNDFLQRMQYADNRGPVNSIFTGGYQQIRGHVLKPYAAIEHDGYGATGSPLNPMGRLGVAIVAPTPAGSPLANTTAATAHPVTALVPTPNSIVLGGADFDANNILVKPAKYFPNYAYKFLAGDVLSAGSDPFYVAIVNPPDANGVMKYGLYRCTSNNGVALTITGIFGAAAADAGTGAAVVTGFSVPGYTTPTWSNALHTNAHPVGAQVVHIDPDAVPVFNSIILGAAAARRGYGKYRNEREWEPVEGKFVRRVFFKTVFGQGLRKDRLDRARGVTLIRHRGVYSSLPLPGPA